MRTAFALLLAALLIIAATAVWADDARLLRFPDISKDQIVFVYAGDLWIVSTSGGQARRLTASEGLELFPRFSPDGQKIAFTGQYDGDQNVFVMPVSGGEPKRLTYHPAIQKSTERMGPESVVMDWTPDGKNVLYRSREETHDIWDGNLYLVSPEGGYPQPLPLPRGGFASFSADGKRIAYCPIYRDFRTWKRYKGGMAQDVWIYDLVNARSEKITDWIGTDNLPMWDGASGKIYFNSDRTGTLNLYVYDPQTKSTTPVTNFTEYDVRWPAMGPGAIVFENGGYLYILDLPNGTPRKVSVQLGSDAVLARPEFVPCGDDVQDFAISPDGKRALFGARGEIFTVPAKHGNTRDLTNTSNAHEKYSVFSPDGKWIAYVSDASGQDEIYLLDPLAKDPPQRLTTDGDRYKYGLYWSPDSKKLAWSDKSGVIRWIDITTKKQTVIDRSRRGDIRHFSWSPDSKWIAYAKNNEAYLNQIYIYSLAENKSRVVTNGRFEDFRAVFDPGGKYLYFLSLRDFNPIVGNYEFNYLLDKMTEIYAIVLSAKDPSPFAPQSDEVEAKKEEAAGAKKAEKKETKEETKAEVTVTIDFDGIMDRQVKFPIESGQYNGLAAAKGRVYYFSSPMGGLAGPIERTKQSLHVFDMEKREDHTFLDEADGYNLSYDGTKMLYQKGKTYEIIDASGEKAKTGDNVLDLGHMEARVDPQVQWHQIFEECWRLERDFFYDSLMHGVDWKRMHDRYAPLVDHVAHRYDLTYVIGEMIGELACSHTYVGGGEQPRPEGDKVGLLGVNWVIDSAAGKFRIGRILVGQNWRDDRRSPLTEPGITAANGDYVLAINGAPLRASDNPYRLLEHTAGETVTLTLAKTPDGQGSWTADVKTINNESELRYYDWVEGRRHYVDSVSNGRIAYVHIPDMGGSGLQQFTSTYYSQIRKEGMIIDVRWNGGGFVSQLVIERLRRVLGGMNNSRNYEPGTYPDVVFHGYLACLINEESVSDGDIFPSYFKHYQLGPLIGKRTWGGVVGIRGHRPMIDGGFVTTPEFADFDLQGRWVIENHGVEPDIEVDNLPEDIMKGKDAQIDRAVAELLKKMNEAPKKLPPAPSVPPEKR
ncbi:MAG: S41 family peptidase [Candidatus Zixiibacteriota bacterium]